VRWRVVERVDLDVGEDLLQLGRGDQGAAAGGLDEEVECRQGLAGAAAEELTLDVGHLAGELDEPPPQRPAPFVGTESAMGVAPW